MMSQLNGILLPGGAVFIDEADRQANPDVTSDCVRSAELIYQLAMERNMRAKKLDDLGGYFPVWGTCLGFQLILIHAAEAPNVRIACQPMREAMPVTLTDDYQQSQLLGSLPKSVADEMEKHPFACHQHRYCITKECLESYGLAKDWHPWPLRRTLQDWNSSRLSSTGVFPSLDVSFILSALHLSSFSTHRTNVTWRILAWVSICPKSLAVGLLTSAAATTISSKVTN